MNKTGFARFGTPLFILLAIVVNAARAESFPIGDVFRPLVADPTETRFFVSLLHVETPLRELTVAAVGAGAYFGLYRWAGEKSGEGWQVGIFGHVFSQFDLDSSSDDLINSDFRIGLPLSYKRGAWSARARIYHQSSHLGDEFILEGNAPQRVNLSVEIADFLVAWERGGWRAYAGGSYLLRGDPEGLKRPGVQAGLDYVGSARVLFGGRLVGGVDYRAFEELDWQHGVNAKIGLEYGRPSPERRGLTVLLRVYDGFAPVGQFFRDDFTSYGVELQIDL